MKFNRNRSGRKPKKDYSKTEGIDSSEIDRPKAANACLRCVSALDRKGINRVMDSVRLIMLDTGTANYQKAKECQKMMINRVEIDSDNESGSEWRSIRRMQL
jgi:hypothetical protein